MVLSFIGACLLWVGWFGFNAGSALASGGLATSAFVTTHFATAAGVLGWMAADWARHGKPSVLGAISGAVAGLVAVTPASGFVTPGAALVIGLAAGAICYLMTGSLKRRLGYDDSLDVFGVHGAAGTLGALMTGLFATAAVNPLFKDSSGASLPIGLIDGNPRQLMNQAIAVVCSWGLAAIGSFVILKLVDVTIGLRVTEKEEALGLDLTQHGERAYALEPAQAYSAAVLEPAMEPEVDLAAPALMQPQTAFSEAGD
jgi:Amt family ammonium transporter